MRNRRTHENYNPSTSSNRNSWIHESHQQVASTSETSLPENINLNSEIENLFNTYTQNTHTNMGNNPLLDNELESDVIFMVGIESDIWRIPGHKKILADKNNVFQAMFFGAMAKYQTQNSNVITITDIPGKAFDDFIKFLYNDDIEFHNVSSTIDILHVAHKYLCTNLIKKCVFYLDQNLNIHNVLQIYSNIQIYVESDNLNIRSASNENQSVNNFHHLVPSAPMFNDIFDHGVSENDNTEEKRIKSQYKYILDIMQPGNDSAETMNSILNLLCYNCLLFIDMNAEEIFTSLQNIENIPHLKILNLIFNRNSLNIKNELILYKFLNNYLINNLKQLQIPINLNNKRKFLYDSLINNSSENQLECYCDNLLFTIRYLLINNFDQFINYINENENNNLFYNYEIDLLTYLNNNKSHLYIINQNISIIPNNNENIRNHTNINDNIQNNDDNIRYINGTNKSWESYNLNYINILNLNTSRINLNEIYLPLSLRSLPKRKPSDHDLQGVEKIKKVKNKDKRKFAEYVWTVLAFIFD